MTNQNFPRRLLDDAIDHAVRELVHGEPRPGFRRRVFDRLQRPKTRGAWWPTLAIPAAAIAAILLAVVVLRQPTPAPETAVVSTPLSVTAPTPAPTPVRTADATPDPRVKTVPRARELPEFRFGPRTDRVTAASVTTAPPMDVVTDAPADSGVTAPAPIAVRPIPEPSPIVVRPITFSRIDAASPSGSK